MAQILIAGGSGLVGKRLTALLRTEGHTVSWLSHSGSSSMGVRTYSWNPHLRTFDPEAFRLAEVIIVLSGSNIGDHRWTKLYKKEIIESRTDAAATIIQALRTTPNRVHSLIAASAIGYYGDRTDEVMTEESAAGPGFLAETVQEWEAAYRTSPVRTVLLRTGIVLSSNGGALPQLVRPLQYGVCPITGSGMHYMSWIHIDDLCRQFIFAAENNTLSGVYNAVSPVPLKLNVFMKELCRELSPRAIPVNVPGFLIRLILGERSALVLEGAKVSPSKIMLAGYRFQYTDLAHAIRNLYGR